MSEVSPMRYLFVINRLDLADHAGADDAGLDLKDEDAFRGESGGKGLRRHGEAGFGDAVVGPVGAAGESADRGDEDDAAGAMGEHQICDCLGEEVRAFEVGVDKLVEALGGGGEDVVALAGGDSGIVDEEVDAAEFLFGELSQSFAVSGGADIALDDFGAGSGTEAFCGFTVATVGGDDLMGFGEFLRDSAANAPAGTDDEGNFYSHLYRLPG